MFLHINKNIGVENTPGIPCKGREKIQRRTKQKASSLLYPLSFAREGTQRKTKQGYYPFCVPSLEGIRKAVIPSREGTQKG